MSATEMSAHSENTPEVSKQKLFSVEAQCISSIFEDCVRQVEVAASLSSILQINNMSHVTDKDLSKALQDHQILEESLEALIDVKQESGREQEGEDEDARNRARPQLEEDFKNSVRDILRFFRTHPDAIHSLKTVLDIELGESECKLIRGLKVFQKLTEQKLLSSPDEELHLGLFKQVSSAPTPTLESLVLLEKNMATSIRQHDLQISQKQTEIKELKAALERNSAEQGAGLLPPHKPCQPHIQISKKQARLQQEIDELQIYLDTLYLENRQKERVLQQKNEKLENEIENLLQHFDNTMEKKQVNLELNESKKKRDEEELQRLDVPFTVLKAEFDQIQEKRRLLEEKRKEELKILELKTKAAVLAQAWWRGYCVRKALKNKGKSKKSKNSKTKKK